MRTGPASTSHRAHRAFTMVAITGILLAAGSCRAACAAYIATVGRALHVTITGLGKRLRAYAVAGDILLSGTQDNARDHTTRIVSPGTDNGTGRGCSTVARCLTRPRPGPATPAPGVTHSHGGGAGRPGTGQIAVPSPDTHIRPIRRIAFMLTPRLPALWPSWCARSAPPTAAAIPAEE